MAKDTSFNSNDSPPIAEPSTSTRMSWMILFILTALYALNYMDRLVVSVSLEAIKAEFGFSDTQIGLVQSAFFLGVGLITIPAGILVDKWSRKKSVSLMAIIWSIATVATGISWNFWSLITSRLAVGAGEAGFTPGGVAWISAIFPKKFRARANGIFNVGVIVGCIIGLAAGGAIITSTGNWRIAYYAFGIPGVILGLMTLFLPDAVRKAGVTKIKESGESVWRETIGLFKIKSFVVTAFASGLFLVLAATVQTWSVVLLMRAYDLNEAKAGVLMGAVIIPALMSPIIGGVVADRLQRKWDYGRPLYCAIGSIIVMVLYAIQFVVAGKVGLPIYVGLLIIGAIFGNSPIPVYYAISQDVVPSDKHGRSAATFIFIQYVFFTWWGATLVGKISDMLGGGVFGIRMALLAICPFTLAAAALFLVSCKYYKKDSDAAEMEFGEKEEVTA